MIMLLVDDESFHKPGKLTEKVTATLRAIRIRSLLDHKHHRFWRNTSAHRGSYDLGDYEVDLHT